MKPDYKNGIPKGMLFSLIAGTVLAKRLAFAKQTIRKGRDTSCGVPAFHCMASIEKDMLKHPRRVLREHRRWVAMELNKKARVNRLTLSLKVLWTFLSSRE